MEAIWVAAEMRAGAAYAHSALALDEMEKASPSIVSESVIAPAIILVDEISSRSHVRTMTCKVAFHLRLPPQGTDAAGF